MNKVVLFALVAAAVFCFAAGAPQIPGMPTPKCGKGEAAYACGSRCDPKCNKDLPGYCTNGGLQCLGFTCRCRDGLRRNEATGECVEASQCPPKYY